MTSIAAASTIQQSQVTNQVAVAVARKTLDVQASQARAAVDLIKQAVEVQRQITDANFDAYM